MKKLSLGSFFIFSIFVGLALLVIYAPQLDIAVSRYFFAKGHFIAEGSWFLKIMDKGLPEFWVLVAMTIGLLWLWGRFGCSNWIWGVDTRVMLMTTGTMFLGPFVIVNFIFKSFWGRARPFDIVQFDGDKLFSRPLEISDQCQWDCSFMSGHTAVNFWVLSLALLAPEKYRKWAVTGVIIMGCLAGLSRIVQGYHFLSDVVFSAVVTISVVMLVYKRLYLNPEPQDSRWL